MPDLGKILEILKVVQSIVAALQGMGMKLTGEISVGDIIKLIPKG